MTAREAMIGLVECGRAVPHGSGIKRFTSLGREAASLKINKQNGRAYWHTWYGDKYRMLPISQLVWLAHGNALDDLKTVDHIDRNVLNDNIENLRLSMPSEQSQNRGCSKTTPELRTWMRDQFKNKMKTIRGMARELGLCRETVQDIIHGRYAHDQLERIG